MKTRLQSPLRLATSPDLVRRAILAPWPGLGWLLLAGLLVLSPPLWAQVSAVDLAEWGQEKAAPRPAESAPGEITALDTGDEDAAETVKVAETQSTKPRVAVYQFKVRGDLGIPDAGDIIGEWMIGALTATGRFTLMERVLLQKVFEEKELQSSHLADESTLAAEAGRLYGVEAIVSGSAIKWGETISIVARLIDTNTGVISNAAEIKTTNRNNIPDQIDLLARKLVGPEPAEFKPKAPPPLKPEPVGPNMVCNEYPESSACIGSRLNAIVNSPDDGFLALRSNPSTKNGKLLTKIPHSTWLVLGVCLPISGNEKWCKATYDNNNGWVSARYVEIIPGRDDKELETDSYLYGKCALIIASRKTESEAMDFLAHTSIRLLEASFDDRPEIFLTENGRYTIGIIMEEKPDCLKIRDRMLNKNLIPGDSYCATTRRLVKRPSAIEN